MKYKEGNVIFAYSNGDDGVFYVVEKTNELDNTYLLTELTLGFSYYYAIRHVEEPSSCTICLVHDDIYNIREVKDTRHKCHCAREVWLYQGCKCGGI